MRGHPADPRDAERHRLEGELRLARDASSAADAERCFRAALDIAQRQSAKSLELRAATSLARLLRTQGKRGEAQAVWPPFTTGLPKASTRATSSARRPGRRGCRPDPS